MLDDTTSCLTTFATPNGHFRWAQLPVGISVVPEIFQSFLDAAIAGLPGVGTIVDDMIIWGESDTEEEAIQYHSMNLKAPLEHC